MKTILVAFILFIASMNVYAFEISGRVVSVADGDTITILNDENTQFKIRLAGIDAPEKKQAFGNVSKKSLSSLVFGKQVIIEWHKKDRYQRVLGKVLINGIDVNHEQIKLGMAWFYTKYQNDLILDDRLSYLQSEEMARENKGGLWRDKEPIAPWDFRKQN